LAVASRLEIVFHPTFLVLRKSFSTPGKKEADCDRWTRKFEANSFPDKMKMKLVTRRDGRVAEGARLESVYTFTGIGGSNPSLSAIPRTEKASSSIGEISWRNLKVFCVGESCDIRFLDRAEEILDHPSSDERRALNHALRTLQLLEEVAVREENAAWS
jgi:hypothetical protein